ncbi:MAG: UPF0175 family protein [Candidatus Hydrogenedentota bacterium]
MAAVTFDMPERVFTALRYAPHEFSNELRLAAAALWYEQGKVSQEIAAEIAGLDRTDFLLALSRMGKESFHFNHSELDNELTRG